MSITEVRDLLLKRVEDSANPSEVLRAKELKSLYGEIKNIAPEARAEYGQSINQLKQDIQKAIDKRTEELSGDTRKPIDVTSPMDVNSAIPELLPTDQGSIHPLSAEIEKISDIFYRMGYNVEESREIDDQYHMFESLNFPKGHPARDEYDTFMTVERDANGDQLIAPAHTSTMQNRVLRKYRKNLDQGDPIAVFLPDRTFRNEDVDARHEHTFYQHEGVYVDKGVNVGMLVETLKSFLVTYYGKEIDVRINPFYFPFTEPSFEFALTCPFCQEKKHDCRVCSSEGWIELLGCGLIHPNVLRMADIDPEVYTGFAWGGGIERLVMMKNGIEDIRNFQSGKLDFLRQF